MSPRTAAAADPFSYQQDAFNTGRHPLAAGVNEPKDAAIRYHTAVPQLTKKLKPSHTKLLDILFTAGKAAVEKEHQYMAIQKLKHVNLQEVILEHIVAVMEHGVLPYIEQIQHSSAGRTRADLCEAECNGPIPRPLQCALCLASTIAPIAADFAECISQFSDADLEDGVRWLRCFYNCESVSAVVLL